MKQPLKHRTDPRANAAARKVWEEGGSPRAQIDAARAATGQRLVYNVHIGAKQVAKARKRRLAGGEVYTPPQRENEDE